MNKGQEPMLAACGLECLDCDIRLVPSDPEAAERVVAWFKNMGWLEQDEGVAQAIERSMYCQGCHGDRSIHWSAECWILQCCVDDKGLRYCYQCDLFPCQRLVDWAGQNKSYTQALNRLQRIREIEARS